MAGSSSSPLFLHRLEPPLHAYPVFWSGTILISHVYVGKLASGIGQYSRTSRDHRKWLKPIPQSAADKNTMMSPSSWIGLLNGRSIAKKSFVRHNLFTGEKLNFLFLTETWQKDSKFIHLNELCPPGCSTIGKAPTPVATLEAWLLCSGSITIFFLL